MTRADRRHVATTWLALLRLACRGQRRGRCRTARHLMLHVDRHAIPVVDLAGVRSGELGIRPVGCVFRARRLRPNFSTAASTRTLHVRTAPTVNVGLTALQRLAAKLSDELLRERARMRSDAACCAQHHDGALRGQHARRSLRPARCLAPVMTTTLPSMLLLMPVFLVRWDDPAMLPPFPPRRGALRAWPCAPFGFDPRHAKAVCPTSVPAGDNTTRSELPCVLDTGWSPNQKQLTGGFPKRSLVNEDSRRRRSPRQRRLAQSAAGSPRSRNGPAPTTVDRRSTCSANTSRRSVSPRSIDMPMSSSAATAPHSRPSRLAPSAQPARRMVALTALSSPRARGGEDVRRRLRRAPHQAGQYRRAAARIDGEAAQRTRLNRRNPAIEAWPPAALRMDASTSRRPREARRRQLVHAQTKTSFATRPRGTLEGPLLTWRAEVSLPGRRWSLAGGTPE